MITYRLKCDQEHTFDSWFASASAFDKLFKAGLVECSVCGSPKVEKAIMAPRVATKNSAPPAPDPAANALAPNTDELEKLRRHVEENSDYVGNNFVTEARKMHLGDTPERAIYGEAKPEEAKALIDDGIPVAPLPFIPTRKTN